MTRFASPTLKTLLVLSLLAFGISHTSFWLFSDPANFIVHANKIRKGYFADNLEAHRARKAGEPAGFKRLLTEGGYLFTLAAAHAINPNLTYYFNGILLPVFLWMVYWLISLTQSNRGPPLTFLLFLLLLFGIPNLRFHIEMYCLPYRDMSAHSLALLSLVLGIKAVQGNHPIRWLALSGFALGLGIWFRLPVFLFVPAAAFLLLQTIRPLQTPVRIKAALFMGLGGLCGLIPLFVQNLLEGKRFYQSGQMNMMLSSGSLSTSDAGTTTISLANASYNAWPQIKLMLIILPWPIWMLIAAGVIHGWKTYRVRTITLLSVALSFMLFYACYIKPVPRYIWMADFILLPFAASGIAAGIQQLLKAKPQILQACCAALVLVVMGLCTFWSLDDNALNSARRTSRDTHSFTRWIHEQIREPAILICGNHALRSWAENYGPTDLHVLPYWFIDRPPEMPITVKRQPLPSFLMNLYDQEDRRFPSVWRNDILNHFELQAPSEKCWVKHAPFTAVSLEAVIPRERTETTIHLSKTEDETVHLVAHASRTPPRAIRILSKSGENLWKGWLNTGPNIFSFAQPEDPTVRMVSDLPLPTLKDIRSGSRAGIRYDFKFYGEIPSVSNYVSNVSMFIYGYAKWERDWGHVAGSESQPIYKLKEGTRWQLPSQPDCLSLRLYLSARLHDAFHDTDQAEPTKDLPRFTYTYADEPLACSTYFIGPAYQINRYKQIDLVQEIWIPKSRKDDTPVVLHRDQVETPYDVILLRAEYEAQTQEEPPEANGSAILLRRTEVSWHKGIPGRLPSWHRLHKLRESTL